MTKTAFLFIFVAIVFIKHSKCAPAVSIDCKLGSDGQWCCKCNQGGIGMNVKNLKGFMLMCNANKELGFIKTFSTPSVSESKPKTTHGKVSSVQRTSQPVLHHGIPIHLPTYKRQRVINKRFRPELDKDNPGIKIVKIYEKHGKGNNKGIKKKMINGKAFYGRYLPDGKFKIEPNYNPKKHRKYKLEFLPKHDLIAEHLKERDCFQHDIHLKNGQKTRIGSYLWVCKHGILERTNELVRKLIIL